jgi:type 1 glutamine amidotransferase
VFKNILVSEGFEVEVSDSLESFSDPEKLKQLHLIIPVWTMGELKNEYANNVASAVESGVGLAGCHGGMCDAFRNNTTWQFLTGSQWVAHPGNSGVEYTVNIKKNSSSPIIEGLDDFSVKSEQYYIHIDPAVNVLASTRFPVAGGPHAANGAVDVPVVYTKLWGKGRVFYNSLGHNSAVFNIPEASRLMRNGFLWASRKDENI